MGLLKVVRNAVKKVDKVTKDLQATVSYSRYISGDEYGPKNYTGAVPLRAIVDWKQKPVRTSAGVLSVSRASVMFTDIAAIVVATAGEGINDKDLIVLPDGTTGPILDMSGFVDANTGHPIATEVLLG